MTTWQEFPLRPQGRPWPGLNTRGGRLDNGTGQLEDGSFGQIINEADILEKRKGFVRGLDERFQGVVCGLFPYTDDCGREFLLVADEAQISIRMPFDVPVFETSDAYPFDDFAGTGAIDTSIWRNTGSYVRADGSMEQASGIPAMSGLIPTPSFFQRWFKEATNKSYQTRVEYEFDQSATEQHISIVMKGNGDLISGAFIQGDLFFNNAGTYEVVVVHKSASGTFQELLRQSITGITTPASGFFTLRYQRNEGTSVFLPAIEVIPVGGTPIIQNTSSLNTIEDADLGQVTGLAMGYRNGAQTTHEIRVVDGGPI